MKKKLATLPNNQIVQHIETDEWKRAFVLWLSEFKSPHTREAYHRAWEQFYAFNGRLDFDKVTTEHIRAWKIRLQKRLEPSSVNQKLSAISSFYGRINTDYPNLRADNPCETVKQISVNPYGKATLLVEDQDRDLLNSIDRNTVDGKRDYAIILLFLTTGVRLAAIANAKMEDIRHQGAVVYFSYVAKRGQPHQKRLPPNTLKALQDFLDTVGYDEAGSLFGLNRHQIQYRIKKRCDSVFGKGHRITPHSLRHTAANNAALHGSIQDVRSLLDHESTRVTSIYLDHITPAQGEKMSEDLDARYE